MNLWQHFLYELYLEIVQYKNLHCSSVIYIMTASDSYRNDNIHDMQHGNRQEVTLILQDMKTNGKWLPTDAR